eukprot:3472461-Prymnesium_polylepis.2
MPSGFQVADPPSEELLEYKGEHGPELVGHRLLFNWAAVGWMEGTLTAVNTDGRFKVKVCPDALPPSAT